MFCSRRIPARLWTFAMALGMASAAQAATNFSYNFDDYANGSTPPGMQLVGNAVITDDLGGGFTDQRLRLTFSSGGQQGSGWRNSISNVSQSFDTTFTFQISFPGGGGADGFSFNVHNLGSSINVGENGPGVAGSLTVAFDTWNNGGSEPSDNFIRVFSNGADIATRDMNSGVGAVNMSDSGTYTARVAYAPGDLDVYINGVQVISNVAVTLGAGNGLVSNTGSAYVGFGGRTGGATENHDIKTWSFSGNQNAPTAEANGAYAFSASQLSQTLSSAGTSDAETTSGLLGYSWQVTGGPTLSGASPTMTLAQSGLSNTTSTNTVNLTVTDLDGATAADGANLSYTNSGPAVNSVTTTPAPNYGITFNGAFGDADLAANGLVSSFENLIFEFDLTQATSAAQVGNGFLVGTTGATQTTPGTLNGTLSLSQLISLFGGLGTYTAWANVRDLAGAIHSVSFQVNVVPEPASLAIWSALGTLALAMQYRRRRG